jgi:hypothetical protein
MGYYLEDLYKPNPDDPVKQALSTRHNFRVIMEKLNNTMAVINNLVIRNHIVYTYVESIDATHPFEMDFHIPTATSVIKKISLTLKGVPFRSYSKTGAAAGTPSGGGSTTPSGGGSTTASGGGSTSGSGGGQTSSNPDADHYHRVKVWQGGDKEYGDVGIGTDNSNYILEGATDSFKLIQTTATSATHTHTVANHTHTTPNHTHDTPDHTHETPDHTHPDHTHTAVYGIYESTTPTAVNGYYDNGAGYSAADSYGNAPDTSTPWNIKTEYNITSKYSGTGWKRLKLDTSRLGRFNVILMIEVDLTPTS